MCFFMSPSLGPRGYRLPYLLLGSQCPAVFGREWVLIECLLSGEGGIRAYGVESGCPSSLSHGLSGCSTTLSPQAFLILNWGCILCSLLQWAWHPSLKPDQKKWQPCPPSSPSRACLITAHRTYGHIQVFPGLIQGSDEVSPSRNSLSHLLPLYWNPQGIQNARPLPQTTCSTICCSLAQKSPGNDQTLGLAKAPPEWQGTFLPTSPPPLPPCKRRHTKHTHTTT